MKPLFRVHKIDHDLCVRDTDILKSRLLRPLASAALATRKSTDTSVDTLTKYSFCFCCVDVLSLLLHLTTKQNRVKLFREAAVYTSRKQDTSGLGPKAY